MVHRTLYGLAALAALCCVAPFAQAGQKPATASQQPVIRTAELRGTDSASAVQNVRWYRRGYYRPYYGNYGYRSPYHYGYRYPSYSYYGYPGYRYGYRNYGYPAYRYGYGYPGRGFSFGLRF